MHVTTGNGLHVNYEVSGPAGAPVVLCLHSLATDLGVWDAQVPALAERFRVVRPDLRGHGGTVSSEPPYTLELLRDDAIDLLDALAIERCTVVGLSIGGILALGLAIDAPDRVERAVIADCRADAPAPYVAIWDDAIATIAEHGLAPVIESSAQRWFSESFRAAHPDVVAATCDRAMKTSVNGYVGCARAVQGLAYLPRLGEIGIDTLFIVGESDPAASPEVMRDMASRVNGSELVVIPGAGHLTSVEAPDAFTEALLRFLDRP